MSTIKLAEQRQRLMSTIVTSSILPPPASRLARFSVEQYHPMIKSGAFTEDDRIELVNLQDQVIELHTNPQASSNDYADRTIIESADACLLPVGNNTLTFRLADAVPT